MRVRRIRLAKSTFLCLVGLVVAGVGLAYCVHLGAQRGDSDDPATSAAAMEYLTSGSPETTPPAGAAPAPSAVTRSKMLMGTVGAVGASQLVLQMEDGRVHTIGLTDATHYESTRSDSPVPVRVGDLVVVHVVMEGDRMTADLVVDGRVTAVPR